VGSNQRRTRWGPQLPAPNRGQAAPEDPPERRRCGEVWGTRCRAWVGPPDYTHGEHPPPGAREAQARDPECPPGMLQLLAEDPNWEVRWRVASNPSCPPGVLAALAGDHHAGVRWRVAGNPASPPGVLAALARDPGEWVRWAVARNPGCPRGCWRR